MNNANYTLTISDTDKIALDTVINPHNMGIGQGHKMHYQNEQD